MARLQKLMIWQKKQHEKKKKQWRENSKRYYTKKKQLKAILDTTPVSDEDEEANEMIQNVSASFIKMMYPLL